MSTMLSRLNLPEAIARDERTLRPANAYFLYHLAQIVGDLSGLTKGDDEYDYFVRVPVRRMHVLSQQIADLTYDVRELFHEPIRALPVG